MANMTFALDASTKKQFTDFCNEVGLSASSVINVCIKTIVRERRIPFIIEAPHIPNAETIAALEEGDRIFNVAPANRNMVMTARSTGASAKFAGSGGAIVGTYEDDAQFDRLSAALAGIGCQTIRPVIA